MYCLDISYGYKVNVILLIVWCNTNTLHLN